jgi:hypothetical protein
MPGSTGCAREIVFSRFDSLFGADLWDAVDTEALRAAVFATGEDIRRFVDQARHDARCLWILGM